MKQFSEELKKEVVRLHIEEGRTIKSLAEEYHTSKASVSNWVKQYRDECQINPQSQKELESMEQNRKLMKENAELRKENELIYFLKENLKKYNYKRN